MHYTLFGEHNGKQGRHFRLRLEYSDVELQSAYRIEKLPAKATVFSDRPRGTERAKQINARRGI